MRFVVYCHTNRLNGKKYVGQTCMGMMKRWYHHVFDAKTGRGCSVFAKAIRKHGEDAFEHEVLAACRTQEETNAAEKKWIVELNSRVPAGYNLDEGGGRSGSPRHPDSIARMRVAQRARMARMAPADRSALVAKGIARRTPEQRVYALWASRNGMLAQSAETQEEISRKHRERWTPELRATASAAAKQQHASEDPSVRAERYARVSAAVCARWAARGVEERRAITAASIATRFANTTPEQRRKCATKASLAAAAASPEIRSARARKSAETRRRRRRLALAWRAAAAVAAGIARLTPERRVDLVATVPPMETQS